MKATPKETSSSEKYEETVRVIFDCYWMLFWIENKDMWEKRMYTVCVTGSPCGTAENW